MAAGGIFLARNDIINILSRGGKKMANSKLNSEKDNLQRRQQRQQQQRQKGIHEGSSECRIRYVYSYLYVLNRGFICATQEATRCACLCVCVSMCVPQFALCVFMYLNSINN